MIDIIEIIINPNHSYICGTKIIGRLGENATTRLKITVDEVFAGKWLYVDFQKPYGDKFLTPRIDIVDNIATYDIPLSLLNENGELSVQIVLKDATGWTWKSTIKKYTVSNSINAADDIPNQDDFLSEAQNILDEVVASEPSIGSNGDWFLGETDTGVHAKGDKGDQGIQGASVTGIEKTSTSGLVDTYTMNFSDGNSTTYEVTNGEKGEQGIQGEKGNVNFPSFKVEDGVLKMLATDDYDNRITFELHGNNLIQIINI